MRRHTPKLKATTTVYCYYFPEVRRIIDAISRRFPHKIFLRSISPGLDNFHTPVMKKYVRFFRHELVGIKKFSHRYVAGGASESIFHLLAYFKTREPRTPIYVLSGEYQGYREYAKALKIIVCEVEEGEALSSKLPKGIFFLSNPSARDGMIIPNAIVATIAKRHKIILDMTYLGLTRPTRFDLLQKNIIAVVTSFSKPFGIYYYRIGFVFSRFPIESLEPNKWFKNIFSLIIADRILTLLKPGELYCRYLPLQKKAIALLHSSLGIAIKPADVLILGTVEDAASLLPKDQKLIRTYKRGQSYRFCLTSYFLTYEKHKTF